MTRKINLKVKEIKPIVQPDCDLPSICVQKHAFQLTFSPARLTARLSGSGTTPIAKPFILLFFLAWNPFSHLNAHYMESWSIRNLGHLGCESTATWLPGTSRRGVSQTRIAHESLQKCGHMVSTPRVFLARSCWTPESQNSHWKVSCFDNLVTSL